MIFELQESGVDHAKRRFLRMGRHALDARPAFSRMADEVILGERRLFASSAVRPLAPATVARKLRDKNARTRSDAQKPRKATSLLENTLTHRSAAARAHGQVMDIGPRHLRFGIRGGSDIGYGILSQTGDTRQPARKVLEISPLTRRRFRSILRDHLVAR